jgi:hypothetical protein
MPTARRNFSTYFQMLFVLFTMLLLGQLAMLAVFYFTRIPVNAPLPENVLDYYVPGLMMILVGLALWLRRNRISAARARPDLPGKLRVYKTALVLGYALLEMAFFVPAMVYFISRDKIALWLVLLPLGIFAFFRPDRNKLVMDLDLSHQEQALLDDPEAVVF